MGGASTVTDRLEWVAFGSEDSRLRASWRFVLAWPLLPIVGVLTAAILSVVGVSGVIPGGPVQGMVFLAMLLAWARAVDRRPLSDYGVTWSWRWLADLLAGFVAVLGVWTAWHALAASLGWLQVEPGVTAFRTSVAAGLVGTLVSVAINTWVQDVVFFAIVLASAAEGLHSRGVARRRAVLGGWGVAVLFFTAIHGTPTAADAAGTLAGGAVFGLLYVHTGELALTIGVHWGASYAAGAVFQAGASGGPAVFAVTRSLPDALAGWVSLALYPGTYLLLIGWLVVSRGSLGVEGRLASWTDRRPAD